jgi:hypothetical protein
MNIEIKEEKIPTEVGSHSLVGIGSAGNYDAYPLSFGNYFTFRNGYRAVNFWAENLKEWANRKDKRWIEVKTYTVDRRVWAVVIDEDAKDWTTRVCLTGCGAPRAVKEAMAENHGFDFSGSICGCEEPEEYSKIGQSWRVGEDTQTCKCSRCGRTWEVPR